MLLLKSILVPKLLKLLNACFNFDLKFMKAHTKIITFVRNGYNSLLKSILFYSFTTTNNRPHYQNHNFCKTFMRLLTKLNTFACSTTLLKSQLLPDIHTLLTRIKTFHSFTTKPSVTLATGGRGEENQPPRLMAASAFASVFEPGHTCLLYIHI